MELWPRRSAPDDEVAGREEEKLRTAFRDKIRHQDSVNWVRKENTELGQDLPRRRRHYCDGKSSTKLWRWRREKAEEETAKNDGDAGLITWLKSKKKPRHGLHRASAKPKTATATTRTC